MGTVPILLRQRDFRYPTFEPGEPGTTLNGPDGLIVEAHLGVRPLYWTVHGIQGGHIGPPLRYALSLP